MNKTTVFLALFTLSTLFAGCAADATTPFDGEQDVKSGAVPESNDPLCGNAENQDNKPIYSCCKEGETFTDESLGCGAQAIYGCMQPSGTCVFRTTTGFESGCPNSMGCGACLGKDTNNAAGWCGEQ